MQLKLTSNLPQVGERIKLTGQMVASRRKSILTACGVYFLSRARRDFEAMSRKGTSSWGEKWKPITREAIASRLMKRKIGQQLLRKLRRGPKYKAYRAATIHRAVTDPEFLPEFYAAVDAEYAKHQIGVDQGRLRNSAQPGFKGDDGEGGNVFEVTDTMATVGYGRSYAGHFDKLRELLPDEGEVPADWIAGAEAIAKRQTLKAVKEGLATVAAVDVGLGGEGI